MFKISKLIPKIIATTSLAIAGICNATNFGQYTIVANDATKQATVTSSVFGSWVANFNTYSAFPASFGTYKLIANPGHPNLQPGQSQIIEFDFSSPDYFSADNTGHFGVFVRGDLYAGNNVAPDYPYRGHGVILGNVTGAGSPYFDPQKGPAPTGCGPTPANNVVALEVAGANTSTSSSNLNWNCVFGGSSSSLNEFTLENNISYHLRIVSSLNPTTNYFTTTYTISKLVNNGIGSILVSTPPTSETYSYQFYLPQSNNLDGFFIAESFSNKNWTLYISDLNVYVQ